MQVFFFCIPWAVVLFSHFFFGVASVSTASCPSPLFLSVKRRRLNWQNGMPWLCSVQPAPTNAKAISPDMQQAIADASLDDAVSHPSVCANFASQKKNKRTPHQFLNGSLEEACDVIRNITRFHNMPNLSIKKYMHPLVKEDDRLFTGLRIVHHSWRLQWNSLGEYLADFEPVEDCPCDMCNGQYEHPTLRKMLQASVCSIYSLRPAASPDLLCQHWPNMNCVLGDCYICGWNNISPPCPHCPLPDDSLQHEEYTRIDLPTKNGNTYRKTESVVVTNKVSNLLINMQEGLNEFKRHHFSHI